jgi:hypothetical protein
MTTSLTVERSQAQNSFPGICLIVGQLITAGSTFLWEDSGRHSVDASTMIILSMVFIAAGLPGVFDLFKDKNPWYARLGLLYAFYGCIGGVAFGFEGLFLAIFHNGDQIGVEAAKIFPTQMNLVLFWSGPAFPLSILVLGIMLWVRKIVTPVVAIILIIAAIGFPVSRIVRIEWLAHLDDLLLLAGFAMLGFVKKG